MALYMIGLGLNDEKDISVKGLEAVKRCDYIFLEDYTSMLSIPKKDLENYYGKDILLANRELVEKRADEILEKALEKDIAFLVIGDVFSATTHVDLYMRAKTKGIDVYIVHNTSVLTAVGIVGLELYKYGKTTSMPYFMPNFRPETPYDVTKMNQKNGLHTLILLDIKKDEDRFMSVNEALQQLSEIEETRKEGIFAEDKHAIGCARLGSSNPSIKYGKIKDLLRYDFGGPLHCIIMPGKLHFMEEDMLKYWERK